MLTHAARQFVLMQRFFHNPKRQRGILLRRYPRSNWLAVQSLAYASGYDCTAQTPRVASKSGPRTRMLTHAARQFVLMQRFFHNPKRQRGILLRRYPRSNWLAVQSLAYASGYDCTAQTPRDGIKKRGREPACSRMRLASLF